MRRQIHFQVPDTQHLALTEMTLFKRLKNLKYISKATFQIYFKENIQNKSSRKASNSI